MEGDAGGGRTERGSEDRAESVVTGGSGGGEVYVLTRAAARELDRLATEEFGLPSIVLMENAAIHLADVCLDLFDGEAGAGVVVVCGPGNNGGDGYACARHLANAEVPVRVVRVGPAPREGDAGVNLRVLERMGVTVVDAGADAAGAVHRAAGMVGGPALVVDALFGTGLDREVGPPFDGAIRAINELGARGVVVVSADVPSGLDADRGEPLGVAVRASATVTFAGLKPGLMALSAQGYVGEIHVCGIGAPASLASRLGTLAEPASRAGREEPGDHHRPGGATAGGEAWRSGWSSPGS